MKPRELEKRLSDCQGPNGNGWQENHRYALAFRVGPTPSLEQAMARMLRGWAEYADASRVRFASDPDAVATDGLCYVSGPHWHAIGEALSGLLNGDLGNLDGGTISRVLCEALAELEESGKVATDGPA